jgi:soluble P-type ATPase
VCWKFEGRTIPSRATNTKHHGATIHDDIPGWGNMDIENILLDLNGTLATDGKIPTEVKERINRLSHKAKIYIVTADTQGTAGEDDLEKVK